MPVLRPQFPDNSSPFSREQERLRKFEAIKSAAARRFNTQGYTHTRLEDVAADLGLTKTSISYYFSSKEDLADAVFRAAAEFLHDAVSSASSAPGSAAERIMRLFDVYTEQLGEAERGERVHLAALNDIEALPESVRAHISERASACVAQVNALVSAWIAEADAPLGRSEPASYLLLELLDWLGQRQGDAERLEAARAAICHLLRQGLCTYAETLGNPRPLDLEPDGPPAIFDRDARNRLKREAFLKAGSRLFNQKGFGGTSLAEVASALGVTRGAFYYHIQDKEQFLDQCIDRSLQIVELALDAADVAELGPLDWLHSVLTDLIYRQAAGVEPLIRPSMAAVLAPPRQRRYRTRLQTIARRLGDALSDGVADGSIRALEASALEEILSSILFVNGGYTVAAANSQSSWGVSQDPRTATEDYLYLVFHGLKGAR